MSRPIRLRPVLLLGHGSAAVKSTSGKSQRKTPAPRLERMSWPLKIVWPPQTCPITLDRNNRENISTPLSRKDNVHKSLSDLSKVSRQPRPTFQLLPRVELNRIESTIAMGTEILLPHDCLNRQAPSFRRPHGNPDPNPQPKPFKKHRSRSPRSAKHGGGSFDMGRVKILKRGEPLDSSSAISDPKLFGSGRLDPDPEQIRFVAYAGSAFSTSPSPISLPLPTFSRRREEEGSVVDHSATKDLRRLLRLD